MLQQKNKLYRILRNVSWTARTLAHRREDLASGGKCYWHVASR